MPMQPYAMRLLLRLALAAALIPLSSRSATVHIAADTLTIRAERTPLSEILTELQKTGVRIAMDERINPLITANFENRDLGDALKQILSDCDYALTWDNVEGPLGPIKRLSEIYVYKPGDRRSLTLRPPATPGPAQTRAASNIVVCVRNEILLRLRPGVTPAQFRNLLLETGALVLDGIPALGVYRLRLHPDGDLAGALNTLAGNRLVATAEPNLIYKSFTPARTGAGSDTLARVATASQGPAVAVLDSGFIPSAALEKAVVASLDATVPGQPISDPVGHGTQMAFLASGAISPAGTIPSAADIGIIPVRTMDDNGITSQFSIMQGLVFAVENGARVISMSWGTPVNSALFTDALAYVRQRDAVLVAAAGNEPTGQPLYPAAFPGVLAVAATTADGSLWDQSNYGAFVKLAAPGFANLPVGYKGPPGLYGGTSIATAYTANIIAQYLARHPKASAQEAVSALIKVLSPPSSDSHALHPEIPRLNNAAIANYLK